MIITFIGIVKLALTPNMLPSFGEHHRQLIQKPTSTKL